MMLLQIRFKNSASDCQFSQQKEKPPGQAALYHFTDCVRRAGACLCAAALSAVCAILVGYFFHLRGIHIEVRIDILNVVVIFECFEQTDHRVGSGALKLGVG